MTTAQDYEPLEYRTNENASSTPVPLSPSLPHGGRSSSSGAEKLDGGDIFDGEMEDFLLDAFCDFNPEEAQEDIMRVCS